MSERRLLLHGFVCFWLMFAVEPGVVVLAHGISPTYLWLLAPSSSCGEHLAMLSAGQGKADAGCCVVGCPSHPKVGFTVINPPPFF